MKTVLLVEHLPQFVFLIRDWIESDRYDDRDSYRVLEAATLEEAKKILGHEEVDVVVCHSRIRESNGKQESHDTGVRLLQYVQQQDPTLQVIFMTNYATSEDSTRAMQVGAFDFLDRNPSAIDFKSMLLAKMRLAIRFRKLQQPTAQLV